MELSVREWMMIVGVLLIVAVFLDGYRRVRNERRNRIRVSLSKQALQFNEDDDDDFNESAVANPELPNGGARVGNRRRDDLQLHESVPMLMESVHVGRAEPPAVPKPASQPRKIEPTFETPAAEPEFDPDYDDEPVMQARQPEPEPEPLPEEDEPVIAEAAADPVEAAPKAAPAQPQEVLVINVISKDEAGFKGPDLLQILLACDLRFGKMNIFHRYEKANGRGQVQFSVANLVEPGVFDLDAIDSFATPGVSFFLALPGPEEPIRAFDYMVETAQVLVKNLHAELRDEAHSVITAQTLEHCRQRIRDFERKQLTLHV